VPSCRSICLRTRRRFLPAGSGPRRLAGALFLAALGLALDACTAVPYYSQAIAGQFSLLTSARPLDEVIADPATPADVRERLRLAARIRAFASRELALPDNRSYTRYADLHRSSAVWNVFATAELSLTLKTWCYPMFGCAGYRGYFAQRDAEGLAAGLQAEGLDVYVGPVPAYSTLGWFSDPLLSTFIRWPEPELARLIFHELAHQVVYVSDDTRFNESFATAVEQAGLVRWVAARHDPALDAQFARYRQRHGDFLDLMAQAHRQLEDLYASGAPEQAQRSGKQAIFAALTARYRRVRDERWGGYAGYDAFFEAPWNNARVAAMAAYQDDVPAFDALLAREQGDLPRFFAAVRQLARLAPEAREQALQALLPAPVPVAAPAAAPSAAAAAGASAP